MCSSLPYATALEKLLATADGQACQSGQAARSENVSLSDSVGRVAGRDHGSLVSTPAFDSSAMDGYAVISALTRTATPEYPVSFCLRGGVRAGEHKQPRPVAFSQGAPAEDRDDLAPCVEVMTGAQFPVLLDIKGRSFDACVKWEDTNTTTTTAAQNNNNDATAGATRTITTVTLTRPVPAGANKRNAGEDVQVGDIVLRAGETIRATHLMCLASVGLTSVAVSLRPRVGIWSTGDELLTKTASPVPDVNGPFLTVAAREAGAEACFLGTIPDDPQALGREIRAALGTETEIGAATSPGGASRWDILIASGGVSGGNYDFVRPVLLDLGATIVFHGLAIRPGHPVLFATLPRERDAGVTAFFGLPGNPGAAAACFRFLVVPYIRQLRGQPQEVPVPARLLPASSITGASTTQRLCGEKKSNRHKNSLPKTVDRFCHGMLRRSSSSGNLVVTPSSEQSPAKLRPFSTANCWMHFKADSQDGDGTERHVECYPMSCRSDLVI
ncbi:MoaB/Mog domain-containing protein [Microdochium bolleyi]|uniref:molybdopterin adenylyltransferase n=1 Tax=Microdochium bolleyi TaxID=196109 RepID=A0A136ISX0_9PEZI|nr:MoaB/Mog domain-containing protein [Microdochium bolleyi]